MNDDVSYGNLFISIYFTQNLDSLKAFGEKTADLFRKDVTPDENEEKANIIVIDGEKNDALDKERESVLFQFQKVSDGLDLDKELDVAQLKGDIKRAYPDGGLPMVK